MNLQRVGITDELWEALRNDIQHYKRSLVYFDDVPESSWKGVQFIGKSLSSHTIKEALIGEVAKYSQSLIYS